MKFKITMLAALGILAVSATSAFAQTFAIDESGNYTVNGNPQAPGIIQTEPFSGMPGLAFQLPFPGNRGDVVISEQPGAGSDLVRFPGNGFMYFFSFIDETTGPDAIADFYRWRESRGERVARHVVTNFRLGAPQGSRAKCECIMLLYAADGRPVLPSLPAIMIADIVGECVRNAEGRWQYLSHRLIPIFEGGVPATIPPEMTSSPPLRRYARPVGPATGTTPTCSSQAWVGINSRPGTFDRYAST